MNHLKTFYGFSEICGGFRPRLAKLPQSGLEWLCVCFWYGRFTVVAPKVNQQYKVVK